MSVGIDIGGRSIKIIELSKEGAGWKLLGAGVVGHSAVTPENAKDDKGLSELVSVIKKLHTDARISSKKVTISLPESQVFTRSVKFPLLTDQEIASAVKWEAEQYIPIPIEEAIVQHQIIGRQEGGTMSGVTVLLVAATKALVEKYIKVVQSAGMTVMAVETELMAAVRSLAPEKGTYLIVDFGARSTDMAVSRDGSLSFSRSITTAGDAFSRSLSQTLGVDERQAEEYKRAYGMSPNVLEGKVRNALMPVFGIVVDEIKRAIHFYQSEQKGDSPHSVVLSGGSAGMPGVVSELTRALGIEVVIGNPFSKISLNDQTAKSLSGYFPLYSIATGLAMRGV